uniref:Acyl-[acyl-carrier-protein] desaturase n=2 Tax=Pseudo-nitzschia australis TaxID=44445 RepID=A0A7S4AN51_9STRA|mmetsp:Transcript_12336/g.26050  ORF Transcript_12336/g.26050 Transcript_12336/m.26050 type:complete len:420 (+) Transcript_12336:294-1553(+)
MTSSRGQQCDSSCFMRVLLGLCTVANISAFQTQQSFSRAATSQKNTQLNVAVDPSTVTKKEVDDIVGADFEKDAYLKRLQTNEFLYPKHVEVIEDIGPIANAMVDEILLETGEASWQPQDYLPDLAKDGWEEDVKELRAMAKELPDEVMVVLVGDMVTEEALPTYQTLLNTFEGCDDPIGNADTPWAKWSRGWTSEENRHGDLLNKYLYLTGKCDMRAIEVTIQHLITSGFNPDAQKDPYRGFVYTSFQERATKVSHSNVGRLAGIAGDSNLRRICAKIAGDEARHEKAYQLFSEEILKRDPDGLIMTFGDMMRGQIVMPAELMTDGVDTNMYENFSAVAQKLQVYTAIDYAEIIGHLVKRWDLENLEGLSPEAEKEREYLCKLPTRYKKLAERSMNRKKKVNEEDPEVAFSWIHGRTV